MEAVMATTTNTRGKNGRFSNNAQKSDSNLGVIAGAAAGGLALGVLAMLGRKAAVQAPTALAGNWDQALKLEHAATLKVFDLMEATDETNTTKRTMLLSHLKHALMKHAIEEENVIYPALREAGQIEAADALTKEHGYVKQYLYELENIPNSSPAWILKLRQFRTDIEDHIREEEEVLFPLLVAELGEEKNKALTLTMNKEGFKVA
jgi:hemerythrin-like domain-containing protein